MPLSPIQCFENRCLKLKIVDFENMPITELVHPETGEEVGDLLIRAYDVAGKLLGEHLYAKGKPELDMHHVAGGWIYLEFLPLPRPRPKGYPEDEEWDQLTLAADIIAHKAIKASAVNGIPPARQALPKIAQGRRSRQQTLPQAAQDGWCYRRVPHGALNLPQRMENIDGKMEEVRPKQRCSLRFMLDEQELRCPTCRNHQTKYLLDLAPLFCWIPALAQSKLGAANDWDSITANNLAVFAELAYAAPDTRNTAQNPEDAPAETKKDKEERAPYDTTILYTLDNLRTQRERPYRVNAGTMDMVLHEVPYGWCYHDMQFHAPKSTEKNPTDSQAFMATNKDTILISVRGTESPISKDTILDLKISLKAAPSALDGIGEVHSGFLSSFEFLWEVVYNYCYKHQTGFDGKSKRIFVTGHSLGGAVATLLACALFIKFDSNPITLYTYASPRVGDAVFARHWNLLVPHMRHVYRNDIIPAVPPYSLGYRHFGHLRQLSLVKAKGTVFPWIGDYGLHQIESAIDRKRRYKADNAPWGPGELTGYETTENGVSEFIEKELRSLFRPFTDVIDLAGARFHSMASKYVTFLQNELQQRYKHARSGKPLLSENIHPSNLDMQNDFDQELYAYMKPVTLHDLMGKHVAELHPEPAVEEEVSRFCRHTDGGLSITESQAQRRHEEEERAANEARQVEKLAQQKRGQEFRKQNSCHRMPEHNPSQAHQRRPGMLM
jgi:hypothetical protein